MITIRQIYSNEKKVIQEVVNIHMNSFTGFFLTFMGKGFLNQMYSSYCKHVDSGLLVAFEEDKPIGFLSYSGDFSGLYLFMIKTKLIFFVWFGLGAFFRKPIVFTRLIKAFLKPNEVKRKEKYVELSSIGVIPGAKSKGVGSQLIKALIEIVDFNKYKYINLETDAVDNEGVNYFYQKNGFIFSREYITAEGRKMNEYRYSKQ
ncbi:GNAT family N-acetyltransferase [Lactonifactor longoviformis]|uniref:Acetyltransferase (GNAT) family protein n=2 Tax=Lactonifactor TaxID=420345 RepID=A0A1M4YN85_9CLOT|nr:GNAT family N-acetyltransferase [Lactonifactor longoviformis]SHF07275.1 Acetyltransferase (GNAT) family protein [Lactonifactor longoviformis DSM 17459]